MKTAMRVAGIWIAERQILLESLVELDLWGIPGGTLEPEETIEAGCIREYKEEIGIDIQCHSLAIVHENFWDDDDVPIREYGFYFIVAAKEPSIVAPLPVESLEGGMKFRWFPLDDLLELNFVPEGVKTALLHPQLGEQPRFISTRKGA